MKYFRQKDKYSCGPVAILNALKHYGIPATGQDLSYIKDLCQTTPAIGTNIVDFHRTVMKFFEYDFDFQPLIRDVVTSLKKGRATLTFGVRKNHGAHFFLLTGVNKSATMFETVGLYNDEELVYWISRKDLRDLLRARNAMCWYIL